MSTKTTEIRTVICTNTETMRGMAEVACTADWLGDSHAAAQETYEANADDYTDRLIRAAMSALPQSYESDSHFPNWNGGKYSHQAKLYGWTRLGVGGVVFRVVEIDDEGEETEIPESDWTEAHKHDIAMLDKAVTAAVEAEAQSVLHDYAGQIIRDMAERIDELTE